MKVVLIDVNGDVKDDCDCDECGRVFVDGVMSIVGETIDEQSGRRVPEVKLFCSHVCSDLWKRKHQPVQ